MFSVEAGMVRWRLRPDGIGPPRQPKTSKESRPDAEACPVWLMGCRDPELGRVDHLPQAGSDPRQAARAPVVHTRHVHARPSSVPHRLVHRGLIHGLLRGIETSAGGAANLGGRRRDRNQHPQRLHRCRRSARSPPDVGPAATGMTTDRLDARPRGGSGMRAPASLLTRRR